VIFSPSSRVFEAHFQELSKLEDLQWTSLHKSLNRKIIIIDFQNQIYDAKSKLQDELFKNMNYQK